jgi:uncharacterized damage-inducible protein DinB
MTRTIDAKEDLFFDMLTGRIASYMNTNNYVIQKQTEGLSHADSVVQLPFRGNCMNWVLGHIVSSRGDMLEILGGEPPLTAEENALYETRSEPITNVEDGLPLERLLAGLEESGEQVQALLAEASPDTLLQIFNEERGSTRLDALLGLIWHETYHAGQFEYLRQAAGTNDRVF